MAITILPIDADPGTGLPEYSAQSYRQAGAVQYGGGSGRRLGVRSGFRVDTPSNVLTATSTTWTLGPCAAMIDPGAATHQGGYEWASDANIVGTGPTGVVAADATNARKDIVYIQVSDTVIDGSGSRAAPVLYLAGTAAPTPVAPTLPARSFLVGTITVPQSGGGSPTVELNSARYAAAGASLPVASATERDALTKYDSLEVVRKDLPGRPTEITDGTSWFRQAVTSSAVPVNDGFWTMYGGFTKTVHENVTQVTASLQLVRTGIGFDVTVAGNALIVGLIPAGFRPPGNFSLVGSILTSADARYAEPQLIVNNGGSLVGRSTSGGNITISTGSKLFVTGTWYV